MQHVITRVEDPLVCFPPKILKLFDFSNLLTLNASDEDYSRCEPCALNLISTFYLFNYVAISNVLKTMKKNHSSDLDLLRTFHLEPFVSRHRRIITFLITQ